LLDFRGEVKVRFPARLKIALFSKQVYNRTMKILKFIAVLLLCDGGGLFAEIAPFSISAGAGGRFGFFVNKLDVGGGFLGVIMDDPIDDSTYQLGGAGPSVFVDLSFAEVKMGVSFYEISILDGNMNEFQLSCLFLDVGVLAKLPLSLTDVITIFPLAGFNYARFLSVPDVDNFVVSSRRLNRGDLAEFVDTPGISEDYFDRWALDVGVGVDFNILERLYFRSTLMYEVLLPNKYEKEMKDLAKAVGGHFKSFTSGPVFTMALGVKLYEPGPAQKRPGRGGRR
jgi:hypothetical protein